MMRILRLQLTRPLIGRSLTYFGHQNQMKISSMISPIKNVRTFCPATASSAATTGIGIAQDKTKAVEWFTLSANQGDARAQCNLGLCYYNGTGIAQDKTKAVEWFTLSAKQGDAQAQCCLGLCYSNGIGISQDKAKAVEWYTVAANQGDARAQCNLGVCYYNGTGIAQDKAKAVEWYTVAAQQGDAQAQCCLGMLSDRQGWEKNENMILYYFLYF
jgi:TPR repeat protein